MNHNKDIHTEHCCKYHGCKFGNVKGFCTVMNGTNDQSYSCEECGETESKTCALKAHLKMVGYSIRDEFKNLTTDEAERYISVLIDPAKPFGGYHHE